MLHQQLIIITTIIIIMSQCLLYYAGFILGGYFKSLIFGCPVTATTFIELKLKNRSLSYDSQNSGLKDGQLQIKKPWKIYRIYLTLVPELIGVVTLGLFGTRMLKCLQFLS